MNKNTKNTKNENPQEDLGRKQNCILSIIKNDTAKNQDYENFTSGGFEKAW